MPRLYLSAAHKSSGKTTLTLGLCRALRERGRVVQPFKKGPDYIDPLWLGKAAGRPCYNLDYNVQSAEQMVAACARLSADADITLIEGNKGLFDGLDLDGCNSNAALARLLEAPVVLVIDCVGMTRGIAPLLRGYTAFEDGLSFAGVILNMVGGPRHEEKLRAAVEEYTDLPVLGAVRKSAAMEIKERHLGLIPSNEQAESDGVVSRIATLVADQVNLDAVEALAARAPVLPAPPPVAAPAVDGRGLRIGIARDAAFAFYYPDDLDALTASGAELVPIDTLTTPRLPEDLDGLILGGGFPETQMPSLEANVSLRADIATRLRAGLPCYAECGGLMYLSRRIRWNRKSYAMVGLIPGDAVMNERPRGRGYVRLRPEATAPWTPEPGPDGIIAAHEFHYSTLEDLDEPLPHAFSVERGEGIDGRHDGLLLGNTLASYAHMRGNWVTPFLRFVRKSRIPR